MTTLTETENNKTRTKQNTVLFKPYHSVTRTLYIDGVLNHPQERIQ